MSSTGVDGTKRAYSSPFWDPPPQPSAPQRPTYPDHTLKSLKIYVRRYPHHLIPTKSPRSQTTSSSKIAQHQLLLLSCYPTTHPTFWGCFKGNKFSTLTLTLILPLATDPNSNNRTRGPHTLNLQPCPYPCPYPCPCPYPLT